MTGWRRWGVYVALTVIFAVACVGLGIWQFERRAETVARIELIQLNYDARPVPLEELVPVPSAFDPTAAWRPVTISGTYLNDETMLVRNRGSDQGPGFEILVPLKTPSGEVFVVDRGWIDKDERGNPPTVIPPAPQGEVTVTARLRPSERTPMGQSVSANLVPAIDLGSLAERWNAPTYTGGYGVMMDEEPSTPAGVPLDKPSTSEGNHLSYAFQWLAFAVLGIVALLWAVRRERRLTRGETVTRPKKSARGPSDAEVEDALVDDTSVSRR